MQFVLARQIRTYVPALMRTKSDNMDNYFITAP